MKYKQYDVVKILEILNPEKMKKSEFDLAAPKVGDVAAIIEIYTNPVDGYELECCDKNGVTQWMVAFEPSEVRLEKVWES